MTFLKNIRQESQALLLNAGYLVNPELPLLEGAVKFRSEKVIADRALALHLSIAKAYGYPINLAIAWLKREGCIDYLTPQEKEFIEQGKGENADFKVKVEAVWLLTWALSLHENLNPFGVCDNSLITLLPDLNKDETSQKFKNNAVLRSCDTLVSMLDFLYCLHWSVIEVMRVGEEVPGDLPVYAVAERRRALEWCCSEEPWEEITLDT
ncbi:DUF4272 domain-containing protein [Microbulbifer sp. 2201CG32-9]|uniref:DUF4272 domain-containing protein n=1 Tax=Microbulbifer sp. 2201CG32-9 TaxID=3232309 RepID=UPI00345C5C7E